MPGLVIQSDPVFVEASSSRSLEGGKASDFKLNTIKTIKAYPNPIQTGEPIYIEVKAKEKSQVRFIIYNLKGQKVKEFTSESILGNHTYRINSTNLAPGSYILASESKSKRTSHKIIIQ